MPFSLILVSPSQMVSPSTTWAGPVASARTTEEIISKDKSKEIRRMEQVYHNLLRKPQGVLSFAGLVGRVIGFSRDADFSTDVGFLR